METEIKIAIRAVAREQGKPGREVRRSFQKTRAGTHKHMQLSMAIELYF
jgi:hypothetical protein